MKWFTARMKPFELKWYHWTVILASLFLTIGAWRVTVNQVEQKHEARFDNEAKKLSQEIVKRIERREQALQVFAGALQLSARQVDYPKWQRFVREISMRGYLPVDSGVGLIHKVPKDRLAAYLSEQKKHRPNFHVKSAPNVEIYWPITFNEEVESPYYPSGLDINQYAKLFKTAKTVERSAAPQLTPPLTSSQNDPNISALMLMVPLYQNNEPLKLSETQETLLSGILYTPIAFSTLVENLESVHSRGINFTIKDGNQFVHSSAHGTNQDGHSKPEFQSNLSVPIFGRQWDFYFESSNTFVEKLSNYQHWLILICGLLLDCALILFILSLTRSRQKAKQVAEASDSESKTNLDRLQRTINGMNDGLMTIDDSNRVLTFNCHFLQMLGYTEAEVRGATTELFVLTKKPNPLDAKQFDTSPHTISTTLKRKDQSTFPAEISVSLYEKNGQGEQARNSYVLILRDISASFEIEQSLVNAKNYLEAAIQSSPTAFAIIDRNFKLIETNRSLLKWLGFESNQLLGQTISKVIAPTHYKILEQQLKKLLIKGNKIKKKEILLAGSNGTFHWGSISVAAVENTNRKVEFLVVQIVDIRKEKQLVEDLRIHNSALQKSNADLEQFAYIASHDLKSPLIAIMQLSQWIQEDCEQILPEASKEHLSLLGARAKRMKLLLEDLLQYSKVSSFDFSIEDVNLKELVDDQLHLLNVGDRFSIYAPNTTISVPRTPIETVIRNLIANSIKHHDKDQGVIEITVLQKPDHYLISASDDGPGIPSDMHKKVFEMFQTLKPRDSVEGSGMGLAMVKRIVQHYKGEISISPTDGRGARFNIIWPIVKLGASQASDKGQIREKQT